MSSSAPASPPVISPPAPPTNTTSPPPAPSHVPPPAPAAIPPPAVPPLPISPPPPISSPAPPPTPSTPSPLPTPSPLAPPQIPSTPPTPTPATLAPPPTPSTAPLPPSTTHPPPHPSPPPPSHPSPPPPPHPSPPPPSSRISRPPPPPTPRQTLPPPSPYKPSLSGSSDDSGSKISVGVVVVIAIAGVAILALLSFLFLFCKKKKKRKHHSQQLDYYGPRPPGPKVPAEPYGQTYGVHVLTIPPKVPPPPGSLPRPPPPLSPSPPPPTSSAISSGGSGSMYASSESPHPLHSPSMAFAFSKNEFKYEQLASATDGFSDANLLGQGGFGYVHKGVLPNGQEVAVKQLKAGSGQGEREFQAEVEVISRVHHKHLVSLVGYCITGSQRLLVYEFVPNNTLEFHLHGKGRPLDWSTRLKIALGAAKGLAYLHEDCHPKIIHRDIKASNILLDFNFEPMVADFGLAKFTSDANTHVSTRVMGTFGYLAPEYASSGKLTDKSDVFSFGVVLLELITGRRPVDTQHTYMDESLVDWARPLLIRAIDEENFDALIDPRLQDEYNHKEMARVVACASACVTYSARRRPRMSQVVRALEGDVSLSDLSDIRPPGFPGYNTLYSSSHGSSEYDTIQYKENMKKFMDLALRSKEYGSNEYSEPTSEYGLNPSGSSSEAQSTGEMEMGNNMKKDRRGFGG